MLQTVPADLDLPITLLGIYMNPSLSFNDHIKSISSSRLSSLCQINRVKHPLDQNRLQNSRFFFSKSVNKSVKRAVRVLRARSLRASVFSLVPDLLFDCSRVLEYTKIRTVLQSKTKTLYQTSPMHKSLANSQCSSTNVLLSGQGRRIGISINYRMFKTSQLES